MRSTFTALGLALALTFGGSLLASPQADGALAQAGVEDRNSDGAYLVAGMALLGLAGLAGITRRDYVRAHRRIRRRSEPVETASPSTSTVISPVEPIAERATPDRVTHKPIRAPEGDWPAPLRCMKRSATETAPTPLRVAGGRRSTRR